MLQSQLQKEASRMVVSGPSFPMVSQLASNFVLLFHPLVSPKTEYRDLKDLAAKFVVNTV